MNSSRLKTTPMSTLTMRHLLALFALVAAAPYAWAQGGYIDQEAVEGVLNARTSELDDIPEIFYDYYILENERDNSAMARNEFYKFIGEGDAHKGRRRSELVHMINRRVMQTYQVGDTIIMPSLFDQDFRAYSPFPRYYHGAVDFDKIFIMDKTIQAFAAYEHGRLVRWGIINTGNPDESPTPYGRYNFNWQEPERVSSESPPDEEWLMRWVMNFHLGKGMHVHQYEMPTGGPMSHGCVRLVDADAEWLYHWADTWTTTSSSRGIASAHSKILKQGTIVLVIGTEPEDKPVPFDWGRRYPTLKEVILPNHPWDVPPGTSQQVRFDELRQSD